MIPLVCGDPAQGPASYTRFVLPFAYSLRAYPGKTSSWVYKPYEPVDLSWRQDYLTVETAAVLFHRAKWFELKGMGTVPNFPIVRDGRPITVCLGVPRLVLFEWPTSPDEENKDDQGDLLCIGFLIVETYFPKQEVPPSLDDLLEFNERFRLWQRPYEGHEKCYQPFLEAWPLDIRRPDRVVGDAAGNDDFPKIYFERWASLCGIPVEDKQGKTWQLFPKEWTQRAENWVSHKRSTSESDLWDSGWIVYTDNRAFVWTCAIVEGGGHKLQETFSPPAFDTQLELEASAFGHWIKLLNVDLPGNSPSDTHKTRQFERDWAQVRTYRRWEALGTFYGFNYHCGAMLGRLQTEPPLWKHFGEMYFDQTLLLLYLRVGSFRYSRRLGYISAQVHDEAKEEDGVERWQGEFQKLRWSFALFTNLYEFPLLSSQQQGLEMYELARQHMDVEQLFREIQEEIRSSHEYLQIRTGQYQTEITTLLTVVATIGLALGLAFSFLGMNVLPAEHGKIKLIAICLFISSVIGSLCLLVSLIWFSKPIGRIFKILARFSFRSWFLKRQ